MTDRSTPQDTPSSNAGTADPADRLPIGPVTRANAAKVLEQTLSAVWAGILESHGRELGEGWDLVIGELHLERHKGDDAAHPGGAAPANGVAAPVA